MEYFSVEGVRQMFGGPIFEGQNKILLFGKVLKFGVIFQKYALKLIKIWKTSAENREKCIFFRIFFYFWGEPLLENSEYNIGML